MKKLLALVFVASLGLAVVGCNGNPGGTDDSSSTTTSKIKDKTPAADE